MKNLILFFLMILTVVCQEKDPNAILNGAKEKFEAVEDYTVDANIKIDVSFLQVPESHATVYFKKPDKIKLSSEGFALLPKDGFNFSPSSLLAGEYTAIYVKEDTLKGNSVDVIKVIPNSDTLGLVLSTLWVNTKDNVVDKIEVTTKKQGTVTLEFNYDTEVEYALPSMVKFLFNSGNLQIPSGISGNMDGDGGNNDSKESISGSIIIDYNNYKVNQGLDDSIFRDQENK